MRPVPSTLKPCSHTLVLHSRIPLLVLLVRGSFAIDHCLPLEAGVEETELVQGVRVAGGVMVDSIE